MNPDRASATARLIAAATVMREPLSPGGAAAAWCERFLSTNRADRLLLWSARSMAGRAWWRCVERAALPGIVSHWMRRKREIDRLARDAAADGFSQLIVLGAGLDTLAFRLGAEQLYERVISADHPATLGIVRVALGSGTERAEDARPDLRPETGGQDGSASRAVELVALNLVDDDICDVLTGTPAFDSGRAALVVIEGVLMYLAEPVVSRVLRSLARLPAPRVRLIASWMLAEPGQPVGFHGQSHLVPVWLRRRSEPMLWASTPTALPSFLDGLGWTTCRVIPLDGVAPGEPIDSRGLRSEKLVVAECVPWRHHAPPPHVARRLG